MSLATQSPLVPPVSFLGVTLEQFRGFCVWLMMVSSFFVIREPAPGDLLFLINFVLFIATGLRIPVMVVPLVLFLLLYNLGGFISYLEVSDEDKAGMFVLTTAYMSASGLFFAAYVAEDPLRRMKIFCNAYVVAAVIASLIALASYFKLWGLGYLSPEGRATGTFKDPNVLSTFLIFPAVILIQGFMLGNRGHVLMRLAALLITLAALFLAFSRGAWISFIAATALMILLTFALTPSAPLRARIIFLSIIGAIAAAILIAGLLSIEDVRQLFLDRLTLLKSYDSGERGRFGIQANSLKYLLSLPLGFGPTLFRKIFGQDPHDVYLNAFASYGWLGGCSYLALVISTVAVGFRAVLTRTPWQNWSIAVFCPLLTTILQGVQIDTDHWRHLYWMIGLMWGLAAASWQYRPETPRLEREISRLRGRKMVGAVGFEPTTPTPPE